jgi:hypothetical protein
MMAVLVAVLLLVVVVVVVVFVAAVVSALQSLLALVQVASFDVEKMCLGLKKKLNMVKVVCREDDAAGELVR